MPLFRRSIRAVLICAALSVALAGANAWADLTTEQTDALQTQAAAGDKTALDTLMSKARQGKAPSARMSVPGNLLKALDEYLAGSASNGQ